VAGVNALREGGTDAEAAAMRIPTATMTQMTRPTTTSTSSAGRSESPIFCLTVNPFYLAGGAPMKNRIRS
jgi:hypothetical protein